MVTNHFGITGISTVILNYCKELDRHKYDLTVIAGKPIVEENRKECAENGICLIELPSATLCTEYPIIRLSTTH